MNIWAHASEVGVSPEAHTDEYMGPHVRPGAAPLPHIFVGDMAPTNVAPYIHRCHVTDEYNLNSSVPTNTLGYICQRYVHQCIRQLTSVIVIFIDVIVIFIGVIVIFVSLN
jgi:hypothetical protein